MDHPHPRSEWFALAANLDRVAGRLGGNPEMAARSFLDRETITPSFCHLALPLLLAGKTLSITSLGALTLGVPSGPLSPRGTERLGHRRPAGVEHELQSSRFFRGKCDRTASVGNGLNPRLVRGLEGGPQKFPSTVGALPRLPALVAECGAFFEWACDEPRGPGQGHPPKGQATTSQAQLGVEWLLGGSATVIQGRGASSAALSARRQTRGDHLHRAHQLDRKRDARDQAIPAPP